ncbi:MAG: MFS transporter [Methylobacterium sp.]|nr:MFS transporter [Rhodobacter sp.]MCA3677264.1 MFS transporter [Methylobacterium sp.]MCA3679613.1 MFS transporter [Methylobacterium sp.]MCA3685193.1 MFS transporter [Methylobacterium sp.]MCA3687459.1 MFS transporter [Methylobacterium sp.]
MNHSHDLPLGKRLVDAFVMLVVAAISMVLLIYVALGEARRNYERFQIEKLIAQGQVVQTALEAFVRPGLPAHQFIGFNQLSDPMVRGDPLIDSVSFFSASGERTFLSGEGIAQIFPRVTESIKVNDSVVTVRHSGEAFQVVLPVRNRFEQVGHVVLTVPSEKVTERVETAFRQVVYAGACVSVGFALLVFFFFNGLTPHARSRWVAGSFVASFLIVAAFVVGTLVTVYAQGAQARAKSLADSLSQRLDDIVTYNIQFDDIVGIIPLFGEYKRLNPDIRSAALIVDGKIRAHADPARRGTEWDHRTDDYEYTVKISPDSAVREVLVKVALPRDIVYQQIFRSVKNFTALFVASAFFAALFMGLARSLKKLADSRLEGQWTEDEERATINLVKPVFFLAVFVEHLSYAFLPPLMKASAASIGLSAGWASLPFVAYYLAFAVSLYPSGRVERSFGAKNLIIVGLALAGAGLFVMSMGVNFWTTVFARGLSGVGQGILFIGVQAYILANSSPGRRTQAGGAIVYGFQAGMIAGMAIGSLLVSYIGVEKIFLLGALIAGVTLLYALIGLPSRTSGTEFSDTMHSAWREMATLMRNGIFARTVILVGIPAKAVLTGVVLFAMPLLLSQNGYAREDIGQITMLYAGSVIVASHFASVRADRDNSTTQILFNGSTMTAIGLAMIAAVAFLDQASSALISTSLIIAGVMTIGIAHGYINAPIVTHVTNSKISQLVGMTSAAAGYRLLERIGHVAGPILVGQLFVIFGATWMVLGAIGLGIFILGAIFVSHSDADDEDGIQLSSQARA